jgi:predicted CXXCH cytochrome family protein
MDILIRKLVDVAGDTRAHQDFEVSTNRLTLGRGTDQDVLLPGERVAYQHADIRFRRGALELRAHATTGVTVNGQNTRSARLSEGDEIRIGGYRLVVITPPEAHQDLALTVEKLNETPSEVMRESWFITGPERLPWLRQRPWAWLGFGVILMIGLVLPALVAWEDTDRSPLRATPLPDDRFWNSGPTSRAHEFIGHQCESCHKVPFQRVPNSACQNCHEDMSRHVSAVDGQPDVTGQRCADCHREHNGEEGVILDNQAFCSDCHGRIRNLVPDTELKRVRDFGEQHPDFRVRLPEPHVTDEGTEWRRRPRQKLTSSVTETSGVLFDHKVHLVDEGVENETGEKEVMACNDCHQPDAGGRGMKPVRMEPHCSRCHELTIEDDDADRTLPHARPDQVVQSLREYFSQRFIEDRPGRFNVDLNQPGAPSAVDILQQEGVDWVDRRTRETAAEIFERRVCETCHKVNRTDNAGETEWSIEPVKINQDYWRHSTRFSHQKHDNTDCAECHDAARSESAGDVLLPDISVCRDCHTGAQGQQGLRSNCVTCHRFHYAEHGKLEQP